MKRQLVLAGVALAAGLAVRGADGTMAPATPESQGVPSQAILDWLDACEKTFDGGREGRVHGFVLVRHGRTIAEGSWKPFDTLNETHMLYSHSKSFTSSAVGFAVDEGLVDLDERVVSIFTNERPANVSANLAQLRVRDLLTMNVGKQDHILGGDCDWAKKFMTRDFVRVPGTLFRYDSDATYMLAAIVERRTKRPMMDYLKAKMFDPIGIAKAWSTTSPQGIPCGGWGMNMTTRELARFGQLYLQKGSWNGKQLLSPDWVSLATTRETWCNGITIQNQTIGSGSDWNQGYGFQFWRCRHGAYRADGASGQLTVVMPNEDAVISVHAGLGNMQTELNLIWDHLRAAMKPDALAADAAAQAKLRARLAALALPTVTNDCGSASAKCAFGKDAVLRENRRGFKSVRLDAAPDGWRLTLATRAGVQTVPVGRGTWARGSMRIDTENYEGLGAYIGEHRTAASGGIRTDGAVRIRIYFTGDTGRMDLVFAPGGKVSGEFWAMGGCKFESKE